MALKEQEDLLNLIEVITKETASIGVMCHEARWQARLDQRESPAGQAELIRRYDDVLRKAVERIGSIIHLASERVDELTEAHS